MPDRTINATGGKPGGHGGYNNGGNGYSGGGGGSTPAIIGSYMTGGNGGSNGRDGGGSRETQGRGTGEDITSYELTHFNISPGRGGQRYKSKGNLNLKYHLRKPYYSGGGGGGVLVGGSGPARNQNIWAQHQGEGYGGGTGFGISRGLPGVILIEVVQAA